MTSNDPTNDENDNIFIRIFKNPVVWAVAVVVGIVLLILAAVNLGVTASEDKFTSSACQPGYDLKGKGATELEELSDFYEWSGGLMEMKSMITCHSLGSENSDKRDDGIVYFISSTVDLHAEFAVNVLQLATSRTDFDSQSYFLPASERRFLSLTLTRITNTMIAFNVWPTDIVDVDEILLAHRQLKKHILFANDIVFKPGSLNQRQTVAKYESLLKENGVEILRDRASTKDFDVLNPGVGIGWLRLASQSSKVDLNTIALFPANAPPDLARVAGIITGSPQTALSHTNVRAKQNMIPNAFVSNAPDKYKTFLDKPVVLTTNETGVFLREATHTELADAIDSRSSPDAAVLPPVDLSIKHLVLLRDANAQFSSSIGAKAANVAELGKLPLEEISVPDGFAVPFHFYDSHMKLKRNISQYDDVFDDDDDNDDRMLTFLINNTLARQQQSDKDLSLFDLADVMLSFTKEAFDLRLNGSSLPELFLYDINNTYIEPQEIGEDLLKILRRLIWGLPAPIELTHAIDDLLPWSGWHDDFRNTTKLRCRSSSSAEDLIGFSGAGLYESYTHKFKSEGPLDATIRQVFSSVFTNRAYYEREIHGIDHLKVYMGVLIHLPYGTEQANGVLVTANAIGPQPYYRNDPELYVNVQYDEVSIVNPEPDENGTTPIPDSFYTIWARHGNFIIYDSISSLAEKDTFTVLSEQEISVLRRAALAIHDHFVLNVYEEDNVCAIEMEFKIEATEDGSRGGLSIKQARPWAWGSDVCLDERHSPRSVVANVITRLQAVDLIVPIVLFTLALVCCGLSLGAMLFSAARVYMRTQEADDNDADDEMLFDDCVTESDD